MLLFKHGIRRFASFKKKCYKLYELQQIREKFREVWYLKRFVAGDINKFIKAIMELPFLIFNRNISGKKKQLIRNEITFCERKDTTFKTFIGKIYKYTITIKWLTKKVSNFFPLKSKNFTFHAKSIRTNVL